MEYIYDGYGHRIERVVKRGKLNDKGQPTGTIKLLGCELKVKQIKGRWFVDQDETHRVVEFY